jgi:hypothetical protein
VDRECEIMRKHMMAIAAATVLGAATISTAAMAQHHGGGGFGGGGGGAAMAHGGGGFGGGAAMAHGSAGFAGGGGAGFARQAGPSNFAGTRGTFNGPQGNVAARGNFAGRSNFAANGFARDHDHDRFRHFRGGVGLFAFGGPTFYDYDDSYADGCWQRRLVPTPFGLRWRLVDVCY